MPSRGLGDVYKRQPSAGGTVPASQLSTYTSNLLVSKPFQDFRDFAKSFNKLLPGDLQGVNRRIDEYTRGLVSGGTLFEELGSTTSVRLMDTIWII